MANPFGIELEDRRLRWAAAEGVSEAVIAAICLLYERTVGEIVARLTTRELEQVINIAGRSPQIYPPGTYEALKEERQRRSIEALAACAPPGGGPTRPTKRINPSTGGLRRTRAGGRLRPLNPTTQERASTRNAEKPGTRPGTRAETARRRMVVEDLRKAGLSVRAISIGTGIPVGSVHRAMCAVARAEAKREVAVVKIMDKLLHKTVRRRG